jgi:hypothetical protein
VKNLTEVEDELIVYCSLIFFRNYWQYTHRPVVTFIFIANTPDIENLVFHDIKEDVIIKQINKINIKKVTGRDGISAKILKIAKPVIAKPISELVNKSISLGKFPEKLKRSSGSTYYLQKSSLTPISRTESR